MLLRHALNQKIYHVLFLCADTFVTLKRRIELMIALPLASLDRMAIQKRVQDIGVQGS